MAFFIGRIIIIYYLRRSAVSVPIAYIAIIIIWSTTPLAIKWSGEGVGYEFGVAARMLLGLVLLLALMMIRKIDFPWNRQARHVYLVSGLSLFLAMASVYWAAQYIPSGWISVVFGISPLMTSILAIFILKEASFSEGRLVGMLIGLAGLCVIFIEGIECSAAYMSQLSEKSFQEKKFENVAYFEPSYLKDFIATIPKKNIFG